MNAIEESTKLSEIGIVITRGNGEVEVVSWEQAIKNTVEFCESDLSDIDEINKVADRLVAVAASLRETN